jgi:hypothetical protein
MEMHTRVHRDSGCMCIRSCITISPFTCSVDGACRQCIDTARFEAFIQFNTLISALGPGLRDPACVAVVWRKEVKHDRDFLRRLATPHPGDSRTNRMTMRNSVNMFALLLLHANLSSSYIIAHFLMVPRGGQQWWDRETRRRAVHC